MRKSVVLVLMMLPMATGGCAVGAAAGLVTAPFKAGAQVVDWTTTSQDESDRNYGRKMRKQKARERHEERERCRDDRTQCEAFDDYRPASR